ncbi:hypothetical protein B7495_00930 [Cryobacterium sp. LW097]|nr:hypothetical protein B7495_00930 [Cryobacterium sp. LW097]
MRSRGGALMYRAIAAELTKIRTLPAALVTISAALVLPPALSFAMGLNVAASRSPAATGDDTGGFEVAGFGQPLVILLAALIVGCEYQNGLLRSSQLAVPNRLRLLGAKAIVVAALAFLLAVVAVGLGVAVRQVSTGGAGIAELELTPAMTLNLLMVGLNWTCISLISAALTVLARSILLPVIVLIPLVLGLGVALVGLLPWLKFTPDLAGLQLISRYPGMGLLEPLPGGVVMVAWVVLLLAPAFVLFGRRDA